MTAEHLPMRPLRILMFTTFYPPYSFGGDAVGVQRMARALAGRGHHVAVVHDEDSYLILGGKPPQPGAEQPDGVRRIGLRARNGLLSNLLTQQAGRPVVHRKEIERIAGEGWDIVWYNNASLVGGPGLFGTDGGLQVYEAHEHWLVCPTHVLWRYNRELCDRRECLRCVLQNRRPPQAWRYTGLLQRQLDKLDIIIAKSEFSRAKHAEFGMKHDMTVLPYFLPPADAADEPQGQSPHHRPYFLFVGRLEKIKGVQDVLPAFAGKDGPDLLVLGDGDYADSLRQQARGLERVKFLGRKSLDELNAYYRHALALIVPSICYETFGIILIESFRMGTPVIARRLGPFPEIVEASRGGFLFETMEEFETSLQRMASDPDLRAAMSASARQAFSERWSEAAVLAQYGRAFADAARDAGHIELAEALAHGALEQGVSPAPRRRSDARSP